MRTARFMTIGLLAFATPGCGWLQSGYNAGHTSFNDAEKGITRSRLGDLESDWLKDNALSEPVDAATGAARWRTAAVTGAIGGIAVGRGSLYVGAESGLAVYAASGCVGVCAPAWSATDGGQILTAPVVAADVVYTSGTNGGLYAFAADGCGGASCASSWSHNTGGDLVHAIVWNSRIYLTDADTGDVEALQLPAS
jgi:hypothetical protein